MTWSHLRDTDARSWTYRVDGFHLDAPQGAKKKVADEHDDVRYRDLRARVVDAGALCPKFVVVVEVFSE